MGGRCVRLAAAGLIPDQSLPAVWQAVGDAVLRFAVVRTDARDRNRPPLRPSPDPISHRGTAVGSDRWGHVLHGNSTRPRVLR